MRAKINPIVIKVDTKSILNLIVCYHYENGKMPYLIMNDKTYECIKEFYTLRNAMKKLPQENVELINNRTNNPCLHGYLYGCKIFIDNELKFGEVEVKDS